MNHIKVKSIEHLNELLDKDNQDFVLTIGVARSSKHITWNGTDEYYVYHYIDDTEVCLNTEELTSSNIGTAINNGQFFCECEVTENDKQLIEQAYAVTNPIEWDQVPSADLADSEETKEILRRRVVHLTLREEGEDI